MPQVSQEASALEKGLELEGEGGRDWVASGHVWKKGSHNVYAA